VWDIGGAVVGGVGGKVVVGGVGGEIGLRRKWWGAARRVRGRHKKNKRRCEEEKG
jgi:hypothetical protein